MVATYFRSSDPWRPLRWIDWDTEGVLSVYKNLTMPLAISLRQIEENGMLIDMDQLRKVDKEYREDISKLQMQWGEMSNNVNIASYKDLSKFLFEDLGLPVVQTSRKTGAPSTGNASLEKLQYEHECIPILMDLKKKTKAVKDFLGGMGKTQGMLKYIEPDGRVHTNLRVDGTDSGRLASRNPNAQNISKDPNIRSMFIARPGYAFIECDYAALELRVAATLWNDLKLLQAFEDQKHGLGDPHTLTASVMFDKKTSEVTYEERNKGKTVNFAVLYAISAYSLAFRLNQSVEDAEGYISGWFNLYDNIKKGIKQTQRNTQYLGYAENIFGRKRRLPDLANPDKSRKGWENEWRHLNRVAANFVIQSTGSDVLSMSTNQLLYDPSPEFKKLGVQPIASIHDALFFEAPLETAVEAAHMIKQTMEDTPRLLLGSEWYLPAEAKVGRGWGDSSLLKLEV